MKIYEQLTIAINIFGQDVQMQRGVLFQPLAPTVSTLLIQLLCVKIAQHFAESAALEMLKMVSCIV